MTMRAYVNERKPVSLREGYPYELFENATHLSHVPRLQIDWQKGSMVPIRITNPALPRPLIVDKLDGPIFEPSSQRWMTLDVEGRTQVGLNLIDVIATVLYNTHMAYMCDVFLWDKKLLWRHKCDEWIIVISNNGLGRLSFEIHDEERNRCPVRLQYHLVGLQIWVLKFCLWGFAKSDKYHSLVWEDGVGGPLTEICHRIDFCVAREIILNRIWLHKAQIVVESHDRNQNGVFQAIATRLNIPWGSNPYMRKYRQLVEDTKVREATKDLKIVFMDASISACETVGKQSHIPRRWRANQRSEQLSAEKAERAMFRD